MSILIKKGHVADPLTGRNGIYDVLVADGRIEKVEKEITADAEKVIDASGCYVMPGFIEHQLHMKLPRRAASLQSVPCRTRNRS